MATVFSMRLIGMNFFGIRAVASISAHADRFSNKPGSGLFPLSCISHPHDSDKRSSAHPSACHARGPDAPEPFTSCGFVDITDDLHRPATSGGGAGSESSPAKMACKACWQSQGSGNTRLEKNDWTDGIQFRRSNGSVRGTAGHRGVISCQASLTRSAFGMAGQGSGASVG